MSGESGCERCGQCGEPVEQVWTADDALWVAVTGSPYGCLCIRCFDLRACEKGYFIRWNPVSEKVAV